MIQTFSGRFASAITTTEGEKDMRQRRQQTRPFACNFVVLIHGVCHKGTW
ncbi:hypothetical protein PAHAL_5G272800 [Panicum hallii]|uniref:Uncharacterized protein n=1 Tax=Panicum hallii TaxID=206008 RepID=A0A2T8ILF5_9POAL|nr:hypothetical protein PAHAL_5G272800 [Panicum hallii]